MTDPVRVLVVGVTTSDALLLVLAIDRTEHTSPDAAL